jgi:hypothetical protein
MFLIRSLFWLSAAVLLLPPSGSEPPPRVGLYQTALAARALVRDVTGLCERNREACETSRDAAELFTRKLETGAEMVESAFAGRAGELQGTLTAADVAAPWTLPRPRGG